MKNLNTITDPEIKKILDTPCKFKQYDVVYDEERDVIDRDALAKRFNVKVDRDLDGELAGTETCTGKLKDCIAYLQDDIEEDGFAIGYTLNIDVKEEDIDALMKCLKWISESSRFADFKDGALEGMGIKVNGSKTLPKPEDKPLDPKYAEVANRALKELEDLTPAIEDDRKVSLDAHRYLLKAQLELERFISELEEIEYHDKMNA